MSLKRMTRMGTLTVVLAVSAMVVAGCRETAGPTAPETAAAVARPRTLPAGVPTGSAVAFSSRWKRPLNPSDPHDTFRDAVRFQATHLMWMYVRDPEVIREARAKGYVVQASLSTILDGRPAGFSPEQGRVVDRDGNPVTAPWMKTWKDVWWGCVNSDEYRAIYLHHARVAIEGGADLLQQDDPGFNHSAFNWGGCHCPYCERGFETYSLSHPGATLREFHADSTLRFYADMWREIDALAGRPLPKSCNNYRGTWDFYHQPFDFGLAELPDLTPGAFIASQRMAMEEGKAQVFTAVTDSVPLNRRGIAMACATGASMVVPWDVYMGSGVPRYFGSPEEYADLFGFIRGCAEVLDGYEHAGVYSVGGPEDHPYSGAPPVTVLGRGPIYASVRAVPGDRDRPVAIHLVDWSELPGRFELLIRPERFFGRRPLRAELWTPAPYDAGVHDRAASAKEYASLVQRRTIGIGRMTQISIDGLSPYGILVLSPEDHPVSEVGQPAVEVDGLDAREVQVRLSAPAPRDQIRYTLDGSAPDDQSPVYTEPIKVRETAILSARVLSRGRAASKPIRFRLANQRIGNAVRVPDHPDLAGHLKLWLRAEDVPSDRRKSVDRWPAAAGPDVEYRELKLHDGRESTPPHVADDGPLGRPVVRFARETDLLSLPRFADQILGGKGFTVVVVSQSDHPEFGLSGNAPNGGGGVPRLYMTRSAFVYGDMSPTARIMGIGGKPEILIYSHDGNDTIRVYRGLALQAEVGGRPPVPKFGSGGALAIPFWSGNAPQSGDIAEIAVFDRPLSDDERRSIVVFLSDKYGLGHAPVWALEPAGD